MLLRGCGEVDRYLDIIKNILLPRGYNNECQMLSSATSQDDTDIASYDDIDPDPNHVLEDLIDLNYVDGDNINEEGRNSPVL